MLLIYTGYGNSMQLLLHEVAGVPDLSQKYGIKMTRFGGSCILPYSFERWRDLVIVAEYKLEINEVLCSVLLLKLKG